MFPDRESGKGLYFWKESTQFYFSSDKFTAFELIQFWWKAETHPCGFHHLVKAPQRSRACGLETPQILSDEPGIPDSCCNAAARSPWLPPGPSSSALCWHRWGGAASSFAEASKVWPASSHEAASVLPPLLREAEARTEKCSTTEPPSEMGRVRHEACPEYTATLQHWQGFIIGVVFDPIYFLDIPHTNASRETSASSI